MPLSRDALNGRSAAPWTPNRASVPAPGSAAPPAVAPFVAPAVASAASLAEETDDDRGRPIRSILVPLDGTRHAEHALPQALAIARRNRAVLRIAQAYSHRDDASRQNGVWAEDDPVRALREPREHYLQSVVQRITRVNHVPVIATLLESDSPGRELEELQAETDLTVLTSRRRHWLSRLCRESMADQLLERASHPVLLIRGYDAPADLTGNPPCRHVLIPFEEADPLPQSLAHIRRLAGSDALAVTLVPLSEQAAFAAISRLTLDGIATNGLATDGAVTNGAAHAGPAWPGTAWPDAAWGRARSRTEIRIEAPRLRTAAAVLGYAMDNDVDLIAVALPAGRGELSWSESSPPQAIARHSQIPVLVHPCARGAAGSLPAAPLPAPSPASPPPSPRQESLR